MGNIGGYILAKLQTATESKNEIGEGVLSWADAVTLSGWLGLQSGDSKRTTFNAKLEESSHVFLCDFSAEAYALSLPDENSVLSTVRAIIKGVVYDVLLIDNPDEMDEQLEIYLRRVGAWNG